MDPLQQFKQAAAEAAVGLVESGMIVGLGTGSTAKAGRGGAWASACGMDCASSGIRRRSTRRSRLAIGHSSISSLAEHAEIDLTIDGADEIQRRNPGSDQRPRRRLAARESGGQLQPPADHHRR
jgi:ribose 5-phosphate isomerase